MDQVQTEFAKSLVTMKTRGEVSYEFVQSSLIFKNRNELAEKAIAEKTDYTLWLDSDMVFPSTLMIDLLEDMKERDMVTAVCHMRRAPYRPCIWKTIRRGLEVEENVSEGYDDYPRDGIFRIEGCGFACVMVRTSVLEAVVDKFAEAFAPLPGYGEDLSFCIRARSCGFDIHCDPRLQIGHKGTTIIGDQTFQAYRRMEEDMKRRGNHA
jgi:GT2 family glycosyltransferase